MLRIERSEPECVIGRRHFGDEAKAGFYRQRFIAEFFCVLQITQPS